MQISGSTLSSMEDFEVFKTTFENHVRTFVRPALLTAMLSRRRLLDAHYAWRQDISRVSTHERNLDGGLDEYKQTAHAAYWLRRQAPVVEYEDMLVTVGDEDGLYPNEIARREFIEKYGTEFLAFDFGFKFCLYYALENGRSAPLLSQGYLIDVCHMLKFKHVSPHALYLIYRSIFIGS